MCWASIQRYANCACEHEFKVLCERRKYQDDDDQSDQSDEQANQQNEPKAILLPGDPSTAETCGSQGGDFVTTHELGSCPACEALLESGNEPQYKGPGQKMVKSTAVVEVPLTLPLLSERTPRSFYYIHRRKYVVDEEGNEHLKSIRGDMVFSESEEEGGGKQGEIVEEDDEMMQD